MLSLALALQLAAASTPPSGDTAGYWQQRVHYRIAATLDEPSATLRASGTLTYVNNSPDSLRTLYFHQYLNAFRPGSRWSAFDESEGRVRFQNLKDPHYGFERFTAPVRVRPAHGEWTNIPAEYPVAPDSTVVLFRLPFTLAPGDSLAMEFQWDARVSTVPRRQGRRGRHYDFAQWYPKVAVYDRGGWQHNPLLPVGEFYGEFGTFDVTLTVRDDQVIGASGVPVSGDPGWERARRWGVVYAAADPIEPFEESAPAAAPDGFKSVRFIAENVHHFGWSASPHYIYEGAGYIRSRADPTGEGSSPDSSSVARDPRVPSFDTVAIHVLYLPGDEREWGNGIVVRHVATALAWLESIFGPYAYPQLTSLHRIDRGGTEFPMLMMNGSPSLGLNLHEGGHMYAHGILANNEWRSAWLDEGLTDHQTRWAQGLTQFERARQPAKVVAPLPGYRRHALVPQSFERSQMDQYELQLRGRALPLAAPATEYHDFSVYSSMVYGRAETMYGALRDVMGDSVFVGFLRGYYSRWALRHVDELAMRTEAERAYGKPLGWFFDQWVHQTGLLDYSLNNVNTTRAGAEWVTTADVIKRGDYLHPMPVGVRTASGWTIVRADVRAKQRVEIRTPEQPLEVRLDPYRLTDDWDRRNDVQHQDFFRNDADTIVFDWPFLDQVHRERNVIQWRPEAWYSDPGGGTFGIRARSSYQGWVDKWDAGLAYASRGARPYERFGSGPIRRYSLAESPVGRLQGWLTAENFRASGRRPAVGTSAGLWLLDGIAKAELRHRFDDNEFASDARGRAGHRTVAVTATRMTDEFWIDRYRWMTDAALDGSLEYESTARPGAPTVRALFNAGAMWTLVSPTESDLDYFSRVELEARQRKYTGTDSNFTTGVRVLLAHSRAPVERSTMVSSANPTETFDNHYVRPRGGLLAPRGGDWTPRWAYIVPGGAYVRGYAADLSLGDAIAANLESGRRFAAFGPAHRRLNLWGSLFADGALPIARDRRILADGYFDAGVGLALRGKLYDRSITLRADFPILVRTFDDADRELDFRVRFSARDLF